MKYLLDTNACIGYLNGRAVGVRQRLESMPPSEVFVCSVVKAGLFYGAMKSPDPARTLARQTVFLEQFDSLPFDDLAAEEYGRVRAYLEKRGEIIGPNDLLIASIALVNNATLVTHNTDEFKRVLDLNLEDWQAG
jgi:tRNA(fMet)-specific endonuclease VapC